MRPTRYLSWAVWRSLPLDLRRAIRSVLPYRVPEFVGRGKFVSWLEDQLRSRGEHELAKKLLEA